MKILKHILFLLFIFLGFFQTKLEAKPVVIENDKIQVVAGQDFKEVSAEKEWLGLLYFQEESTNQNQISLSQFASGSSAQNFSGEICLRSVTENLGLDFQLGGNSEDHQRSCGRNGEVFQGNPDLVDAWKALSDAGETALRKNIAELDLVAKNLDDVAKFGGYKDWNRILRGAVKNGDELLYRLSKIDVPKPEIYKGGFYRTVDNGLDPLHTHPIPKGKSHRYSKPGEGALYFSSSKEGNIQELTHWGKEIEGNTTTYLYKSIDSENLLDLTNPQIRENLGISLDQITGDSYEFSHVLGSWGQGKYNGIIAPSARGLSDNKYFVNIVIFNSGTANSLIKGKELIKIVN